jgi:hypothetical protein
VGGVDHARNERTGKEPLQIATMHFAQRTKHLSQTPVAKFFLQERTGTGTESEYFVALKNQIFPRPDAHRLKV